MLLSIEVVSKIVDEIKNNSHLYISFERVAESHGVTLKNLQNSVKYHFNKTLSEFHTTAKLALLTKLIADDDSNQLTAFCLAIQSGFSDDSGLQHFIKRNTNLTYKKYYNKVKETCKQDTPFKDTPEV